MSNKIEIKLPPVERLRLTLPSAYLPQISYFALALTIANNGGGVIIDLGEHYIKRSVRNRAQIMTAQGVMDLTIPVRKANRPCQPMHTIEIDNTKRWQHQHWIAILSAYKSSPYFEHYAPYIEPLYKREWSSLTEFNRELFTLVVKLLGLNLEIEQTTTYIDEDNTDLDLRPKSASRATIATKEYIQVFEDRQPFAPNLSIIDLLFCEGPNATTYLQPICR